MTDHAHELRRYARKIPHPQGETPGVMLRAADEIECLRAKIAEMERQEPVGEIVAFGESLHEVSWIKGKLPPLGAKLYALPGVKGEEK